MAVPVRLVSKGHGGNHRPDFRPTGDAYLRAGEQSVARIIRQVWDDQEALVDEFADGDIGRIEFVERAAAVTLDQADALEQVLYGIIVGGMPDAARQVAAAVNADLRRLGSPARIVVNTSGVAKARTRPQEWTIDTAPFTEADPQSAARIEARFQSRQILGNLAASQEAMVAAQVAAAFNQVRPLVAGIEPDDTVEAIIRVLDGTEPGGLTGRKLARYRATMTRGLFPRWATAVNRFVDTRADRLDRDGIGGAQARAILDRDGERYAQKLRAARARNIARTETAIANNTARLAAIQQAHDDGILGANARKQWVTGPFDVCPICTPMSGVLVESPGGVFEWSGGSGQKPPAHPSCRCGIQTVPNVERAPVQIGSGTPEDPFRFRFADGWEGPITPVAP